MLMICPQNSADEAVEVQISEFGAALHCFYLIITASQGRVFSGFSLPNLSQKKVGFDFSKIVKITYPPKASKSEHVH